MGTPRHTFAPLLLCGAALLAACTVSPTEPVNPPDEIEGVSLNINEVVADRASRNPALSADGRYVAFESDATDLIAPADGNGVTDVYRRDRLTGQTSRVSLTEADLEADAPSSNPAISGDGQSVVFQSDAQLTVEDTNAFTDVFIHATTTRILSLDAGGGSANAASTDPAISANGLLVAFQSAATDLTVPNDPGAFIDVFIRGTAAGSPAYRVSVPTSGTEADGDSSLPSISSDGRYVVFQSDATNLISPADTNGLTDIYLRDTVADTTTLVSRNLSGNPADGASTRPVISTDGNWVAFQSRASDLFSGSTGTEADIFLWDRLSDTITRISESRAGGDGDGDSENPAINGDGRYIAFESAATDLVADDSNGVVDLFVHSYTTVPPTLSRVSVDKYGVQVNDGASTAAALSAGGLIAAFQTDSAQLLRNDTNTATDVVAVPTP